MPRFSTLRGTALVLVGLLSVPVTMVVSTTGAMAAPAPCKVVEQGKAGSRSNLGAALASAGRKATLIVTGTCSGSFTVTRTVTLKKGATAGVIRGSGGRALRVTGGTLTVIGLRLTGSTASDCPGYTGFLCGAVLLNESRTILDRVVVSGSVLDGGATSEVWASALYNRAGATMTIRRSTITDNDAVSNGVGLEADAVIGNDGTMSIIGSKVTSNQSSGDIASGGALYAYDEDSKTTIVDSVFADNIADGGSYGYGGAVVAYDGTLAIRRSLFSDNQVIGVVAEGGALWVGNDTRIEDSTFTGNDAVTGGAIHVFASSATASVRGTTIARNSATSGGGIVETYGSVEIGSSIIALNTAGPIGSDCHGSFSSAGSNLIGSGDGCDGFTQAVAHDKVGSNEARINPKLGRLANNGGPTKTLALLKGSPAINAARAAPCDTARDQRGVKRPQGGKCDIGAFEKS